VGKKSPESSLKRRKRKREANPGVTATRGYNSQICHEQTVTDSLEFLDGPAPWCGFYCAIGKPYFTISRKHNEGYARLIGEGMEGGEGEGDCGDTMGICKVLTGPRRGRRARKKYDFEQLPQRTGMRLLAAIAEEGFPIENRWTHTDKNYQKSKTSGIISTPVLGGDGSVEGASATNHLELPKRKGRNMRRA